MSVKYITKNRKTDVREVFLEIKNHTSASIISSRNLRLTETRVCMVWESGSRVWPLKKIVRVMSEITEKRAERMIISFSNRFDPENDFMKKPAPVRRILSSISNKTYLINLSHQNNYLIKSFTAV